MFDFGNMVLSEMTLLQKVMHYDNRLAVPRYMLLAFLHLGLKKYYAHQKTMFEICATGKI